MDAQMKKILIITAVTQEQEAVIRGLKQNDAFDVLAAGVGPVAAAVQTTRAMTQKEYAIVICAGIAGAFLGKAELGALVVASDIVSAELGTETPEGFLSLDKLGFGPSALPVDQRLLKKLTEALRAQQLPMSVGPILTVSTITGTETRAEQLALRVSGAAAEAMEGYGVALAAASFGVPCLEIRAVSNFVGIRDRAAWRIQDALTMLERSGEVLVEVFG